MSTHARGQSLWNKFQSQSVAGRSHSPGESMPLPCSVKPTACKRDSHSMWLMRTPSESSPNSYSRSLVDSVDLKSVYARDVTSYRSHPFIADGDLDIEDTAMSSTRDICDYLIHFSSTSSTVSEVDFGDFQDFDDTDSETDVDSDSDSEAQYITIPPESRWWKAPLSSHPQSYGPLVDDEDLNEDDAPSSHSLSQVLQQQQFLVGVFHNELRRMIPGDHSYDDDWLKEVDAKLLLAPVEAFEEACKSSMVPTSRPLSTDFGSKPLPDVPVDFDDTEDDSDESMEGCKWEYPSQIRQLLRSSQTC